MDHKAKQDGRRPKQAATYYSGLDHLPRVSASAMKYLTDDQKKDLVAQLTR